jgi:hypothetical protein
MKKSRFSDEQIVKVLSSVTGGTTVREVYVGSGLCERFSSKISVLVILPFMP